MDKITFFEDQAYTKSSNTADLIIPLLDRRTLQLVVSSNTHESALQAMKKLSNTIVVHYLDEIKEPKGFDKKIKFNPIKIDDLSKSGSPIVLDRNTTQRQIDRMLSPGIWNVKKDVTEAILLSAYQKNPMAIFFISHELSDAWLEMIKDDRKINQGMRVMVDTTINSNQPSPISKEAIHDIAFNLDIDKSLEYLEQMRTSFRETQNSSVARTIIEIGMKITLHIEKAIQEQSVSIINDKRFGVIFESLENLFGLAIDSCLNGINHLYLDNMQLELLFMLGLAHSEQKKLSSKPLERDRQTAYTPDSLKENIKLRHKFSKTCKSMVIHVLASILETDIRLDPNDIIFAQFRDRITFKLDRFLEQCSQCDETLKELINRAFSQLIDTAKSLDPSHPHFKIAQIMITRLYEYSSCIREITYFQEKRYLKYEDTRSIIKQLLEQGGGSNIQFAIDSQTHPSCLEYLTQVHPIILVNCHKPARITEVQKSRLDNLTYTSFTIDGKTSRQSIDAHGHIDIANIDQEAKFEHVLMIYEKSPSTIFAIKATSNSDCIEKISQLQIEDRKSPIRILFHQTIRNMQPYRIDNASVAAFCGSVIDTYHYFSALQIESMIQYLSDMINVLDNKSYPSEIHNNILLIATHMIHYLQYCISVSPLGLQLLLNEKVKIIITHLTSIFRRVDNIEKNVPSDLINNLSVIIDRQISYSEKTEESDSKDIYLDLHSNIKLFAMSLRGGYCRALISQTDYSAIDTNDKVVEYTRDIVGLSKQLRTLRNESKAILLAQIKWLSSLPSNHHHKVAIKCMLEILSNPDDNHELVHLPRQEYSGDIGRNLPVDIIDKTDMILNSKLQLIQRMEDGTNLHLIGDYHERLKSHFQKAPKSKRHLFPKRCRPQQKNKYIQLLSCYLYARDYNLIDLALFDHFDLNDLHELVISERTNLLIRMIPYIIKQKEQLSQDPSKLYDIWLKADLDDKNYAHYQAFIRQWLCSGNEKTAEACLSLMTGKKLDHAMFKDLPLVQLEKAKPENIVSAIELVCSAYRLNINRMNGKSKLKRYLKEKMNLVITNMDRCKLEALLQMLQTFQRLNFLNQKQCREIIAKRFSEAESFEERLLLKDAHSKPPARITEAKIVDTSALLSLLNKQRNLSLDDHRDLFRIMAMNDQQQFSCIIKNIKPKQVKLEDYDNLALILNHLMTKLSCHWSIEAISLDTITCVFNHCLVITIDLHAHDDILTIETYDQLLEMVTTSPSVIHVALDDRAPIKDKEQVQVSLQKHINPKFEHRAFSSLSSLCMTLGIESIWHEVCFRVLEELKGGFINKVGEVSNSNQKGIILTLPIHLHVRLVLSWWMTSAKNLKKYVEKNIANLKLKNESVTFQVTTTLGILSISITKKDIGALKNEDIEILMNQEIDLGSIVTIEGPFSCMLASSLDGSVKESIIQRVFDVDKTLKKDRSHPIAKVLWDIVSSAKKPTETKVKSLVKKGAAYSAVEQKGAADSAAEEKEAQERKVTPHGSIFSDKPALEMYVKSILCKSERTCCRIPLQGNHHDYWQKQLSHLNHNNEYPCYIFGANVITWLMSIIDPAKRDKYSFNGTVQVICQSIPDLDARLIGRDYRSTFPMHISSAMKIQYYSGEILNNVEKRNEFPLGVVIKVEPQKQHFHLCFNSSIIGMNSETGRLYLKRWDETIEKNDRWQQCELAIKNGLIDCSHLNASQEDAMSCHSHR